MYVPACFSRQHHFVFSLESILFILIQDVVVNCVALSLHKTLAPHDDSQDISNANKFRPRKTPYMYVQLVFPGQIYDCTASCGHYFLSTTRWVSVNLLHVIHLLHDIGRCIHTQVVLCLLFRHLHQAVTQILQVVHARLSSPGGFKMTRWCWYVRVLGLVWWVTVPLCNETGLSYLLWVFSSLHPCLYCIATYLVANVINASGAGSKRRSISR